MAGAAGALSRVYVFAFVTMMVHDNMASRVSGLPPIPQAGDAQHATIRRADEGPHVQFWRRLAMLPNSTTWTCSKIAPPSLLPGAKLGDVFVQPESGSRRKTARSNGIEVDVGGWL